MTTFSKIGLCCVALFSCLSLASAQSPDLADPCGDPAKESQVWGIVKGQVVKVEDGDTVLISLRDKYHKEKSLKRIHLIGIDAPESGETFGEPSRLLLEGLVRNRVIEVWVKTDISFRSRLPAEMTGVAHLRNLQMLDVNLMMIVSGMARYKDAEPYSMSNYAECHYVRAEEEARTARRGLWYRRSPTE
ncbi:MAG TPA: thermonuclease family protein [Pyrinomonadaceae bacterium]